LLLVAPKTTCKNKEGGGSKPKPRKRKHNLEITNYKPCKTQQKIKIRTKNNTKQKPIKKNLKI
jgi:hypothetical protein